MLLNVGSFVALANCDVIKEKNDNLEKLSKTVCFSLVELSSFI